MGRRRRTAGAGNQHICGHELKEPPVGLLCDDFVAVAFD